LNILGLARDRVRAKEHGKLRLLWKFLWKIGAAIALDFDAERRPYERPMVSANV